MKSYDEVTANVLEAARQHHCKVKRIQYAASVSAMCLTCILGLGIYMNLEKPETRLPSTETYTETVQEGTNAAVLPSDTSAEFQFQITEFNESLFLPGMSENFYDSWFATSTVPLETDPIEMEISTETQAPVETQAATETQFPVETQVPNTIGTENITPETTEAPQSTAIAEINKTTSKSTSTIATTASLFTTDIYFTTNVPYSTEGTFTTEISISETTGISIESTAISGSPETATYDTTTLQTTETTTVTTTIEVQATTADANNTFPPETLPIQNLPPSFTSFLLDNLTEEELEQFRQFIEEENIAAALEYLTEIISLLSIS